MRLKRSKVELDAMAKRMRLKALDMAFASGKKGAHLGPAFSCMEIMAALYGNILTIDPFYFQQSAQCFSAIYGFAGNWIFDRRRSGQFSGKWNGIWRASGFKSPARIRVYRGKLRNGLVCRGGNGVGCEKKGTQKQSLYTSGGW